MLHQIWKNYQATGESRLESGDF